MTDPIDTFPRRRRSVRDLDMRQWLLLVETLATLAEASAAIRLLPFRLVVRLASRNGSVDQSRRTSRDGVEELLWALKAVSWRVPWRTVCFQKGLALHLMLRRRGIPSLLHYGIGKGEENELAAHVWISVAGNIVLGDDVVDRFRCVATYPAEA